MVVKSPLLWLKASDEEERREKSAPGDPGVRGVAGDEELKGPQCTRPLGVFALGVPLFDRSGLELA